jgi:hypothetical protein
MSTTSATTQTPLKAVIKYLFSDESFVSNHVFMFVSQSGLQWDDTSVEHSFESVLQNYSQNNVSKRHVLEFVSQVLTGVPLKCQKRPKLDFRLTENANYYSTPDATLCRDETIVCNVVVKAIVIGSEHMAYDRQRSQTIGDSIASALHNRRTRRVDQNADQLVFALLVRSYKFNFFSVYFRHRYLSTLEDLFSDESDDCHDWEDINETIVANQWNNGLELDFRSLSDRQLIGKCLAFMAHFDPHLHSLDTQFNECLK